MCPAALIFSTFVLASMSIEVSWLVDGVDACIVTFLPIITLLLEEKSSKANAPANPKFVPVSSFAPLTALETNIFK